jgi:hypothetical protein
LFAFVFVFTPFAHLCSSFLLSVLNVCMFQPRPSIPHPLAKTKGSRSSPNLKEANFFKEDAFPPPRPKAQSGSLKGSGAKRHSPAQFHQRRSPVSSHKGRSPVKASSPVKGLSPVQVAQEIDAGLLRSVSQTTENSEYDDDADDELDQSFDSGARGSATSISFRNKLARMRNQGPSGLSDIESEDLLPIRQANESVASAGEDESLSSILSLDMIYLDTRIVSPASCLAEAEIGDLLPEIQDAPSLPLQSLGTRYRIDERRPAGSVSVDEVDSPPFSRLTPAMFMVDEPPSHWPAGSAFEGPEPSPDHTLDDGMVSAGFEYLESHDTNDRELEGEETEGAWGGVDGEGFEGYGARGDRTRLRLDLPTSLTNLDDPVQLAEAVHSLKQEIEDEISSFESEIEEGM